MAVVLAAPLAIGGARPGVQVILSACALVAGGAWLLSRRGDVRLPPFAGVAALALGFTLLQLLPLPAGLVDFLSPRALQVRADALGARPAFLPLTLDVPATLLAAARGIACLVVLVVAASASRRGKQPLLVLPLVVLGAFIAVLSFVQRGLGAESILGFYRVTDMPGSGFFGTFVSGNHAASFFTVAALLGLGCARESEGHLRLVLGGCALVCLAAVFSTMSRFGLIGLAAGGFVMLVAWLVNRLGGWRGLLAAAGVGLVAAPLALTLALAQRGNGRLDHPFDDFKVRGWDDALKLAVNYPLVGVGRGAFEGPATAFRDRPEGVRLVFPENLLLQMTTEWGFPISLLLIGLVVWAALPILRRLPRWEPIPQSAACAVIAVLVHDLADFGLEVLGVALPTALALGVVSGRRQSSIDGARSPAAATESAPSGRLGRRVLTTLLAATAFAGAALVVLGASWAAGHTSDADSQHLRQLIAARDPTTDAGLNAAIARHPADHDFALLSARWALRQDPPAPMALRQLNRAQRLFPQSAASHVITAHILARLHRPTQAAIELRLADELGGGMSYENIEKLVGPAQLERAIPRTPERLFDLALYLAARDRPREAAAASARAVMFSESSEASLVRRLQIALRSADKPFISEAARELGRAPSSPEAFELAIKGLAMSGDLNAARELIRKVGVLMPHEGGVIVKGARALMESGDVANARAIIAEGATRDLGLGDRIAGEQLLAEIAEKEGDVHAAAAARARARILIGMRENHAGP